MNLSHEPADIRDETCTNLTILLSLLIRNMKSGDLIRVIATRKQLIQIEEVLSRHKIVISHESIPEDILVSLHKP